jgi:hypothetical protein
VRPRIIIPDGRQKIRKEPEIEPETALDPPVVETAEERKEPDEETSPAPLQAPALEPVSLPTPVVVRTLQKPTFPKPVCRALINHANLSYV